MKSFPGFFLLLLIISIPAFSQQTKEVIEELGNQYNNQKIVYSVLNDNDSIKHGSYQQFNNGNLTISGFYKMDKKDGLWLRIRPGGPALSRKMYAENKRTGSWSFYKIDGTPDWEYDFNTDSFVNKPKDTFDYSYQSVNGEWIKGKADRDPVWLRSLNEWQSFCNRTFRYPQAAIKKNKQGTVVIEVTVDENGDALEYNIAGSVFPPLDEEAIRVLSLFPPEFLPAEKDGKKVKTKIRIKMGFGLERG